CGLGVIGQDEADKAIKLAMDHGINMIDVGPAYGRAEIRLNPWIKKYRKRFFLAEKTLMRKKKGAWKELNRSLERLGTNYFDLYQFHSVSSIAELHMILGEGGAMEAFKEAKETDLIKHIGITSHDDIKILMKAFELSDDFDTVLLPVYVGAMVNPDPINDFRPILQIAQDRNIGVTAIKAIAKRRWIGKKAPGAYNTWYEPLDDQSLVDQTVWYTLSQEGVTTYSLPCDIRLWPLVLNAAKRYQKLNNEEQEKVINIAKKYQLEPINRSFSHQI
ncbi:MAG: aldo/keto reductase, partial [Candidatus Hodarchaeota archaeon]